MCKTIYAVAPYNHRISFKMQVYDAWVKMGDKSLPAHYPWRTFRKLAYNHDLLAFHKNKR